jgi:nickel/cobalt transporter (NicO) family protein
LLSATVVVAVVHSILPDHWVPLAVVGRTQRWSLGRVARVSALAAGGHVLASLVLAGIVALIGLEFRSQVEAQQGHIVGGVLVLTGVGFLIWGLTGRGHPHSHNGHAESDHAHEAAHPAGHGDHAEYGHEHSGEPEPGDLNVHLHQHSEVESSSPAHGHQHTHGKVVHSHAHRHEAFIEARRQLLETRSREQGLAAKLAMIAVPFGVAASPDLTLLPLAFAATAYGTGTVVLVLGVFAAVTVATFVGLTVGATAAGYQVKGEWLEANANTITALVLIVIGVIAFIGL